jgi:hypothetical protein
MPQDLLTLTAEGFDGHDRWHWRLTDPQGRFLADHAVALDRSHWQYRAFIDLAGWVQAHTAPDRRFEEEAGIVEALGAWVGEQVLGSVGAAIVEHGTPVTVQVQVPDTEAGRALLYRPLELAHVDGEPLALQDVSLVLLPPGEPARVSHRGTDQALRVLAVFSLPRGQAALNLRQERHGLKRLVADIAARRGLSSPL